MRKVFLILIIIFNVFLVCGCQNSSSELDDNLEQETQTSDSKRIEQAEFSIGTRTFIHVNNIVSIPAVLENSTEIEQQFSSRKVFLSIDDEVYPVYQMGNRAADFKLTIPAGERWYNTFSFQTDFISDKEMKDARLIYASDDDSLSYSKPLAKDYVPNNHTKFLVPTNSTPISTYYSSVDDAYEKRTDRSDTIENLKERNDDARYLEVQTLVMVAPNLSENRSMLAMYIFNPTKKDFQVPLNTIRLHSASGEDYDIASDAMYDTFLVPAGKWQLALVPLETSVEQSKGPYVVQFKDEFGSYNEFTHLPETIVPTFLSGIPNQDFFTVTIGNVAGTKQSEDYEISLVDEGVVVKITNNSLFKVVADPLFFTLQDKQDPAKIVSGKFSDDMLRVDSNQTQEFVVTFDEFEMIRHTPELILSYDKHPIAEIK